jgi:hypothetical protein
MGARRFHPAVVKPGERPIPYRSPAVPSDPLAALTSDQRASLPNLIGIGAAKCGTSALHHYLADHPEIGTPAAKELKLFGGPAWIDRLAGYAACFEATYRIRCESSPTYTMDPYVPGVPEQMAAVLPDPKFVYVVGDPLRRIVAHWSEHRAMAFERRSLAEALADADDPMNPYVAASRYGHQLERFLSVFASDRVLVVEQQDLRLQRRETLQRIFAFAGVREGYWSAAYAEEPNAAAHKLEPNWLGRWLTDRAVLPRSVRRRAAWIRGVTAGPIRRVALDDETRSMLEALLRPDIERFRELTGQPFESWPI